MDENRRSPHNSPSKFGTKTALQANGDITVTKLMHQCTSMLRDKMWNDQHSRPPPPALRYRDNNGAAQPDNALEAMGPVLESVLSSLTTEYERRLLLKDEEILKGSEELAKCRAKITTLEQSLLEGPASKQLVVPSEEHSREIQLWKAKALHYEQAIEASAQEQGLLAAEYDRVKEKNTRLEFTCKEYQEKIMASKAMLSNYKAMQDENRKLYNQIQDLRGNIRVFMRVRPPGATGDSSPSCVTFGDEGQVALYNPKDGRRSVFAFDKVFDAGSTQEMIYLETQPLIRSVVDGYNVCVFAYGQTGSGKTHTMSGTDIKHVAGRGINYRALDDLFDLQHQRSNEVKYDIRVQMLEVYNEKIRDLLAETRDTGLGIQNTKVSGANVPDALQIAVHGTQDVLDVMARGQSNRATADTKMNERSSRSHSVLTVIVDGLNGITGAQTHGCLHLVDLAGSERVGRSEASGERLEEAKHINKSLSSIGDVMSALASKSKHIPFRNSKLTQLLADSLSGQAKVMMFLHVSPEQSSFGESLSTLKFGSRVSEITLGQAKRNVEAGSTLYAKQAQRELSQRMEELQREMTRRQQIVSAEQSENERLRAENAAKEHQLEVLQSQLQDAQLRMKLGSDHSGASSATPSGMRRTPRLAPPRTPEVVREVRSGDSSIAPAGPMTAEEKHIRRMRHVMGRKEVESGLPRRPRTALGATSTPSVRASMPASVRTSMASIRNNGGSLTKGRSQR